MLIDFEGDRRAPLLAATQRLALETSPDLMSFDYASQVSLPPTSPPDALPACGAGAGSGSVRVGGISQELPFDRRDRSFCPRLDDPPTVTTMLLEKR